MIGVASRDLVIWQFIWQKRSIFGENLKTSLIADSHMTSCNLQNLFLEVWNLIQVFVLGKWSSLKKGKTNSLFDVSGLMR